MLHFIKGVQSISNGLVKSIYTRCPKFNDPTLKSPTDESVAEKIVKFIAGYNEGMGIYLSQYKY